MSGEMDTSTLEQGTFATYKFEGEQSTKTVHFLAKSKLGWITWKQTEATLFWFFERNYGALRCLIKQTAEEGLFGIELELPQSEVPNFEKAFKSPDPLNLEIDKIHGLDPAINYKKTDCKLQRLVVSLGSPVIPPTTHPALTSLQTRLAMLETCDRERNAEVKGLYEQLYALDEMIGKRLQGIEMKALGRMGEMEGRVKGVEQAVQNIRK